jgi:hypothetical protein
MEWAQAIGGLAAFAAVFLVLAIEVLLRLRSGVWPGWSIGTAVNPLISGTPFANWLTDPHSWFGFRRILVWALDLPLWIGMVLLAVALVYGLDPGLYWNKERTRPTKRA